MQQLTVGQRLKRLRGDLEIRRGRKFTQTWVGKQVGVTKTTVAKWETDVQVPGRDYIFRLAEVLETTPEYILTGVSEVGSIRAPQQQYGADRGTAEHAYEMLWASIRAGMGKKEGGADPSYIEDQLKAAITKAKDWGWDPAPLYEMLGRVRSGDV